MGIIGRWIKDKITNSFIQITGVRGERGNSEIQGSDGNWYSQQYAGQNFEFNDPGSANYSES